MDQRFWYPKTIRGQFQSWWTTLFFAYQNDRLGILSNKAAPIPFESNILGVSAIVGQNGAGKSTLCQAILASLATVRNGSMGWNVVFKGIVCFGEDIYQRRYRNLQ